MLSLAPSVRIYLHAKPIDMRKSFDGLFGIIKNEFSMDVRDGGLFLFINLRRNRVKLMYWDTDGLVIWMKSHESEDTHFNIFTRVAMYRTFNGIVDETRSTCF
ncbi:MAG TPA: IS66 family insertion sequence element accessory protein TnpB [Pirellula sp.]|nr:IS66 family insertion sequence element accessory protein TnpB [Pirellula sp.]